jgi:hypothetical protein
MIWLCQVFIAFMDPSANMKLHNRLPRPPLCGQIRKTNSEFLFPVLLYIFWGLKFPENLSKESTIFLFHMTTMTNCPFPVGQMKIFWNNWMSWLERKYWMRYLKFSQWCCWGFGPSNMWRSGYGRFPRFQMDTESSYSRVKLSRRPEFSKYPINFRGFTLQMY